LLAKVVERELARAESLLLRAHLVLVELFLCLFDQRQHVAHAENAAGHSLGMKFLERVQMLAGAHELERHASHGLDREGSAAAGVAVELGHDAAVELQGLVEGLGAVHRVLSRHTVDHQVNLVWRDASIDPLQLLHQLVVDVQPAAGRGSPYRRSSACLTRYTDDTGQPHPLAYTGPICCRSLEFGWPRAVAISRHQQRHGTLIMRPSLPQEVVLPEPCRPHIIRTVTSSRPLRWSE
jgi:hypothetical protein